MFELMEIKTESANKTKRTKVASRGNTSDEMRNAFEKLDGDRSDNK